MNVGFAFFDIILLALIAVFLILRLRSVLGQKREDEEKGTKEKDFLRDVSQKRAESNVVSLRPNKQSQAVEAEFQEEDIMEIVPKEAREPLTKLRAIEPSFYPEKFLEGAKGAFSVILEAFAAGDKKTLNNLLAKSVYTSFASAINEREKAGEHLESILLNLKADIQGASIKGKVINISIKFTSLQTNVLKGKKGKILEGDPDQSEELVDSWNFRRTIGSKNPNWILSEITNQAEG